MVFLISSVVFFFYRVNTLFGAPIHRWRTSQKKARKLNRKKSKLKLCHSSITSKSILFFMTTTEHRSKGPIPGYSEYSRQPLGMKKKKEKRKHPIHFERNGNVVKWKQTQWERLLSRISVLRSKKEIKKSKIKYKTPRHQDHRIWDDGRRRG